MTRRTKTSASWLLALAVGALTTLMPVRLDAALSADLDPFIASLEGGWAGSDNITPFGKMGFAVLFTTDSDGDLHSRSSLNSETYIDLRFSKDETGTWILREEAGMEGLGVQAHSLVPAPESVETPEGMHRWVHAENPDFLHIDVGLRGETLLLDVILRGQEHARFALDRLPDEALPDLKRQMEEAALQSPAEGTSISQVIETQGHYRNASVESDGSTSDDPAADDPISLARAALAKTPNSGRSHLELARAMGAAIDADPANGPRYAFEMHSALVTAIQLDPSLVEAYHWLVGYYLNAPPIAGGSVDKAEATALRLAELDLQGGQALLEQVAARRSNRQ